MKRLQSWLTGLLVLQLVFAVSLFWHGQQAQQINSEPLMAIQPDQLDRLEISDADSSVTLRRDGGHWILPDMDKLPASDTKLRQLLTTLEGLQTGWPVATTDAAQQRFEVSDDKFQRHIQLYKGDTLKGELYVGTSPGFRKSHIRKAGDDNVYTAELNAFDLPVKSDGWLDKSLLAAHDAETIKGADYTLQKQDGSWQLAGGTAPGPSPEKAPKLDPDKAKELAAALSSLQVTAVADLPEGTDANRTRLAVTGPKGEWDYTFVKADDKYFISRSDLKQSFSLSQFDYDRIARIGRADLVVKAEQKRAADAPQTAKHVPEPSASQG